MRQGAQREEEPRGQAVCCYRHPDRETGVRCSRCDRPICPECMGSAPVGFQCPECLQTGRRSVPRQRTLVGGTVAANPRLITLILIGINLAVFLAAQIYGNAFVAKLLLLGSWPPAPYHATSGVAQGQWYRLLTAVFLHQEIPHFFFNMISLWWIGPTLEATFGRARYLTLYLLSGLGGSATTYLVSGADAASLGASGAIFGLLGATFVLVRRLKYDLRPIVAIIVLNLVFTFSQARIDWRAHIGGLVTGTIIAFAMVHAPRRWRALVQWGTSAVMALVIVVMVAVETMQITG